MWASMQPCVLSATARAHQRCLLCTTCATGVHRLLTPTPPPPAACAKYASLCLLQNPGCLFIATNADARGHFSPNQMSPGAGATVGAIKGEPLRHMQCVHCTACQQKMQHCCCTSANVCATCEGCAHAACADTCVRAHAFSAHSCSCSCAAQRWWSASRSLRASRPPS